MNKKLLVIPVFALLLVGCGKIKKAVNPTEDLTTIYNYCLDQNESYICKMNWTLQTFLEGNSNYRLINASQKDFTVKPTNPNDQFTYGASRDSLCNYKYLLFYNSDSDSYYSVKLACSDNDANPIFESAKDLSNGKTTYLPDEIKKKEQAKQDSSVKKDDDSSKIKEDNKNTSSNNETSSSSSPSSENVSGLKVGSYTVKYGTYNGDAAVSGDILVINADGTATLNGESYSYSVGTNDFAQDSSSSAVESAINFTGPTSFSLYVEDGGNRLTSGSGIDYIYSGN